MPGVNSAPLSVCRFCPLTPADSARMVMEARDYFTNARLGAFVKLRPVLHYERTDPLSRTQPAVPLTID